MSSIDPPVPSPCEVKICGLTHLDDALFALDCGADYLGFVLYPSSPRAVTPRQLLTISERLDAKARKIGVFVNEPLERVEQIASDCGLYAVQLHGDETPSDYRGLRARLWRAVALREGVVHPCCEEWPAERYVVDAHAPGLYGGSGKTADWEAAADLAASQPIMLAGGLTPLNVARAVHTVKPLGVDTASGVEAAPGKKDLEKVKAFIEAAKAGETL